MYNNNPLQWKRTISKLGNIRLPAIILSSKGLNPHDDIVLELSEDQRYIKIPLYKLPKNQSKNNVNEETFEV